MKKILGAAVIMLALNTLSFAQEKEAGHQKITVPAVVKQANVDRYPQSKNYRVTWEKEKGNYEANWGGKDGEANSAMYTPSGKFIEIVKAIPTKDLPKGVLTYSKEHYKTTKFDDVGRATDATGKISYEVEINGKDVIFDENGNFVKEEK
jgi:hypothetical protein